MTHCNSKKMCHHPKPSTLLSASQRCQHQILAKGGLLVCSRPPKPSSPHHSGYSGRRFYHWPNNSAPIECTTAQGSMASYTPIQCTVISNPLMGTNTHKSLQQKITLRRHTQWKGKALAGDALKEFITDYGVPNKIIMDGTDEQTGKRSTFMEQERKHHIDYHVMEPERYNQLRVEGVIREIRKKWLRVMTKKYVPK